MRREGPRSLQVLSSKGGVLADDPALTVLLEDLHIAWQDWHTAQKAQTQVFTIVVAAIAATFAGVHYFDNAVVLCAAAALVFAILGLAMISANIRTNNICIYVRCDLIPRLAKYCPEPLGYIDRGITFPRGYGESHARETSTRALFVAGEWAIVVVPGMTALSGMLYFAALDKPLRGTETLICAVAVLVTGLILVPSLAAVIPQSWDAYHAWERRADGSVSPDFHLTPEACRTVTLLFALAVLLVAVPQWASGWDWSRLWTANATHPRPWLATQLSLYALLVLTLLVRKRSPRKFLRGVMIASCCVVIVAFISWIVVLARY